MSVGGQAGAGSWRHLAAAATIAGAALAGVAALRAAPDAPAEGAWFEDVTARAGVAHPHSRRVFRNAYAEVMSGYTALGAAAAVADVDGDGYEDLFVTDSSETGRNRLYRNRLGESGELVFAEVGEAAGVAAGNDARNASADALFFDYDNDGRPDLFVVRFGASQLFHNEGGLRFRDVTTAAGLDRRANAITAVAFDADRDGLLDLLVGGYFQPIDVFEPSTPRFFPESLETAENGGGVTLWRNRGGGRFEDVTGRAGLRMGGWVLDLGHGDADGDGDEDLYVACDFGSDRFFRNDGDGTFTDATRQAIGIDTKKGMNAEWGDFDNDGALDVYVTNITDDYMREGNFLWQGRGDGTFADVARETGTHDTGWGWAGKFVDYDNDGWLDLYVVNGWVSAGPESYVPLVFEMITRPGVDFADARNWPPLGDRSFSGYQKKRLFHNLGGRLFRDEAARHGVDSVRDGRGVAVADLDGDGRQDLFVTNAGAAPYLYRNRLPTGARWAAFSLEGRRSNRDAVGARLHATAGETRLLRVVDGGNGFGAQSSRRVHFGLGAAPRIDRLEVRWPSGLVQTFADVPAGRLYRIVEGEPGLEAAPAASTTAAPAAPAAAAPPELAALEAALAAEPDSLRAASVYRQAAIAAQAHDRAIAFFERLVADHPRSANAWLNSGYAVVDKIPAAGSIGQVILANRAIGHFSESIAIRPDWLNLFTRGNAYLYWPKVFGRAPLAVADLERAVELAGKEPRRRVHARPWMALGDAYWRTGQAEKARATWEEAARLFPGDAQLAARLARQGDELDAYLYEQLDPNRRVDTDLEPLWEER